jgi:MOSC domain-containing protein YiiM
LKVETCEECRFDGAHYNRIDTRRSLTTMAIRWRWAAAGVDESVLARRPAPAVWSASEYAGHTAVVLASIDELLRMMTTQQLGKLDVAYPTDAQPDDAPYRETFAEGVDLIEKYANRLDKTIAALDDEQWRATVQLDDDVVDSDWVTRHAVHDSSHHLADVARGLHTLGAGAPRSTGVVAGVFASGGGVPKKPIEQAVVGYRGVEGDRQATRQHHGRVWQALCLWSADIVERFQAEGHPIALGNAGENVAIASVDWPTLRPGTLIAIGNDVLVEVSAYATPCKKNTGWFLDGDFNRMNHDREPGISRVYASVLHDGVIRPNDSVIVEP